MIIDTDILGFIFPVHYFGPPVIIRRMLENIKSIKSNYIFTVAVNAGGCGGALKIFSKLLRKKGCFVKSFFSLLMPSNHIIINESVMYGIDNEIKLKNAYDKINSISETIEKRKNKIIPKSNIVFSLFSLFWNPVYVKKYKSKTNKLDKNFILSDKCNGCGKCQRICPLNNILMKNKNQYGNINVKHAWPVYNGVLKEQ